ncbi:MAG: cyanophycin synthetase [Candidatus Paceibacterota bacterium]|jgi:D-alanine-D-alanine ligase-like ATP-grasp enzyme
MNKKRIKKQITTPLLSKILQKVAPKVGAKIVMEPVWGIVGQIVYKSGRKRYFRYTSIDANTMGASEVARDKGYANFFMKKMGYRTIPGRTFYSNEWADTIGSNDGIDEGYKYARSLGFPLIVKPNDGSQGNGVSLVHNKEDYYHSMRAIFKHHRIALIEEYKKGTDYRVVVLDDKVISAYERIPLSVMGDGKSNIQKLLSKKQKTFKDLERDTRINMKDPRIKVKLREQGLTLQSIPKKDERIFLLDNANLSSGGDSVDVTNIVHPEFKKMAIKLTKDMGLRLCGVDLMIVGDIKNKPKNYWILEINSAPGLDHYAKIGPEQDKIVENLYLEVLKSLEH